VLRKNPDSYVTADNPEDVPILLGTDLNYGMINGNRDIEGPYEFIAMRRLANGINWSMRELEEPWMIANAGNEYSVGQLIVRSPRLEDSLISVTVPEFSGYSLYINNYERLPNSNTYSSIKVWPSRIIVSYPNYPELFDAARIVEDSQSPSAIDINSADGQEITGLIPFFGESAFGNAQKSQAIVVFKSNSIYLVDLAAKDAGINAVQKVESRGLGCTAPYSIANTKDGIIFANESGIFKLTHSLQIEPVGQKLERLWKEEVGISQTQLPLMQGHHYPIDSQYKLSVPGLDEVSNDSVLVYNHTREYMGAAPGGSGSWTTFDNHPVTGWANMGPDEFFSTIYGDVMTLRRAGDVSDYRDDSDSYQYEMLMRAIDFGDGSRRKVVSSVVLHFRGVVDNSEISLLADTDFKGSFRELDAFKIDAGEKINTIKFSLPERKLVHLQLRLLGSGVDMPVQLTGIEFRVSGYKDSAMKEAASTTSE
jgi:hypothetical protein